MGQFGIGQPVPREGDRYLLRDAGRHVEHCKKAKARKAAE
jgi:hypothetical protein